jgi:hypothetical protein
MVVERNGIRIDITQNGRTVNFRVLDQSKQATAALQLLGHVTDEQTGISLRSNKEPSYNRKTKRLFVRGSSREGHNKVVTVETRTAEEARQIVEAVPRLLDQVQYPDQVQASAGRIIIGGAEVAQGGTTHVRMALISRRMAQHLQLTGHDLYPDDPIDWQPCRPAIIKNAHWLEHQGQVVDVMNKSVDNRPNIKANFINPHRVSPAQARNAVAAFKRLFEEAEAGNYLVAMWRLVTGIRHCDSDD